MIDTAAPAGEIHKSLSRHPPPTAVVRPVVCVLAPRGADAVVALWLPASDDARLACKRHARRRSGPLPTEAGLFFCIASHVLTPCPPRPSGEGGLGGRSERERDDSSGAGAAGALHPGAWFHALVHRSVR